MSQEYYSVEKKSNVGELNIGLQVFETITLHALEQVKGIKLSSGATLTMKGTKNPIIVKVNKSNQITIDIELVVDYGLNVATLSTTVQTKIVSTIFELTGLKNAKVNVNISGVNF